MAFQVTPETDVAEAAMFHGAEMRISSGQNVSTGASSLVEFDTVEFDTDGFCDVANNRFVIPEGVFGVKCAASVHWNSPAASSTEERWVTFIEVNGVSVAWGEEFSLPSTPHHKPCPGKFVSVVPGDAITVRVFHLTGQTQTTRTGAGTWFSLEVVKTPFGRPDSPTLP